MMDSKKNESLFHQALEDLASLIFEEMDPGLSDYMWSHLGK